MEEEKEWHPECGACSSDALKTIVCEDCYNKLVMEIAELKKARDG